jgi:hypothetical protein
VARVTGAKEALEAIARDHAGSADGPLEALLRAALLRARQDLPRPLEAEEQVVSTHRAGWRGRLRARRGALGAAGTVVLTTRRLLYQPGRADPQEVRLTEIVPGTLRLRPLLETILLSTPRALRLSWVERAAELASRIELERWLTRYQPAPPAAPRFPCVLLPFYLGEPQGVASAYSLVLAPSGFAILPVTPHGDLRYRLGTLIGAAPQVAISLEQLIPALRRMEPAQAARSLDALAKGMGTSFRTDRRLLRQHGFANRIGLDRGDRVFWVEPASYDQASRLQTCVLGWAEETLKPSS